ncbi:MAG: 2-succinyl-6-hydroxy-2,4-cyclohexadiene-1-carboxylate synthase [Deltaproteobacteria bacterium]|nr:2-succinyl-6-hydroxy-2,4-cyclohexadiene-1-carboxylate synthase [Deltaproteobacteria bacterium]
MSVMQSHEIDAGSVRLCVEEMGSGPPVVLLHGFTGSARAMAFVARGLADTHRTLSVDLVGHGRSDSPRDIAAYSMTACVEQLVSLLDQLNLRDAHWVGYSMGARAVLALGSAHPGRVASAILVGCSAGIRDSRLRAERVRDDEILAERIEREGVEAFVDFWISQSFLVDERRLGVRGVAEARQIRLANSAHGLASSLRGMGAGAQPPIHQALAWLSAPICLAVGGDDLKFRALATEISQELPNARIEIVPEAGHAAHTDNPTAFLELARSFLLEAEVGKKPPLSPVEAAPQTI